MTSKSLKSFGFSKYNINTDGDVYNISLKRNMSTYINNSGYKCTSLTNDSGIKVNCLVHLLVAKTFVPNPKKLSDAGHIDNDKLNCKASNMEWTTHSANIKKMHAAKKKKKK